MDGWIPWDEMSKKKTKHGQCGPCLDVGYELLPEERARMASMTEQFRGRGVIRDTELWVRLSARRWDAERSVSPFAPRHCAIESAKSKVEEQEGRNGSIH